MELAVLDYGACDVSNGVSDCLSFIIVHVKHNYGLSQRAQRQHLFFLFRILVLHVDYDCDDE